MNTIRFEEAIKLIESGSPCHLKYVTYDHKRKSGGEIKEMEAVCTFKKDTQKSTSATSNLNSKAQNHKDNFTRNFSLVVGDRVTQHIKKVHLYLVLEVNNQKVML